MEQELVGGASTGTPETVDLTEMDSFLTSTDLGAMVVMIDVFAFKKTKLLLLPPNW